MQPPVPDMWDSQTQGRMQYRWVSYHIGQGGKQVEIEKCGAPESTWVEFVASLPDEQCRYGGAPTLIHAPVADASCDATALHCGHAPDRS